MSLSKSFINLVFSDHNLILVDFFKIFFKLHQVFGQELGQVQTKIASDSGRGAQLLRFLYELDEEAPQRYFPEGTAEETHRQTPFWSFTPRLTLTSFLQEFTASGTAFEERGSAVDSHVAPVSQCEKHFLTEFLQNVSLNTFFGYNVCAIIFIFWITKIIFPFI